MEQWRDIQGYEGRYQVSDLGRVRSVDHVTVDANGKRKPFKGRELKQLDNHSGYKCVNMYSGGGCTIKQRKVHRLVAQAFIPNPDGLKEVNHKDGDKSNNAAYNLEWCSTSDNIAHAWANGLMHPEKCKKKVERSDGKVFCSVTDAARALGVPKSYVSDVLHGRRKTTMGYRFKLV